MTWTSLYLFCVAEYSKLYQVGKASISGPSSSIETDDFLLLVPGGARLASAGAGTPNHLVS